MNEKERLIKAVRDKSIELTTAIDAAKAFGVKVDLEVICQSVSVVDVDQMGKSVFCQNMTGDVRGYGDLKR